MAPKVGITLYRVARKYPPSDDEYLSPEAKGRKPPRGATAEHLRSWDALSAYSSEEGARRQAQAVPQIGKWIVCYVIPEGTGVTWEETLEPGHYDVRGDGEELKKFLVPGFCVEV